MTPQFPTTRALENLWNMFQLYFLKKWYISGTALLKKVGKTPVYCDWTWEVWLFFIEINFDKWEMLNLDSHDFLMTFTFSYLFIYK